METVDNQIDPTTGTVKLRAIFDNPETSLFPNQFVNVKLLVDTLHDASIAPISAIQRGAPGTFVYLVNRGHGLGSAGRRLGPGNNQTVAITKGLTPGQVVVTDGADRLKDGAKVKVVEPGPPAAAPSGQQPSGKAKPSGRGKPRSGG